MHTLRRTLLVLALPVLVLSSACRSTSEAGSPPSLTAAEAAEGWQLLFDGTKIDRWRVFRKQTVSNGWKVEDGAIVRVGTAGDLITREQYGDFILDLEWNISKGGNSGILFHVTEDCEEVWETGPEMQILDNVAFGDGLNPKTSAGANYALHAPAGDFMNPAGKWNHARIEVRGPVVTHYLNGHQLLSYTLWSAEWKELVAGSKFSVMPGYGMRRLGHIALQDHGNAVSFRNIKILPLD